MGVICQEFVHFTLSVMINEMKNFFKCQKMGDFAVCSCGHSKSSAWARSMYRGILDLGLLLMNDPPVPSPSAVNEMVIFFNIFIPLTYVICTQTVKYFHNRTVHLDIIKVLLPTDTQENCFKRRIKIYSKTAPTCFGVITIIRECTI